MPHAVVGQPRVVAGGGQFRQTVMHHDLHAARVGNAVAAEERIEDRKVRPQPHAKHGVQFDFDVFLKGLDLAPGAAGAVGHNAHPAQIGHEQIGQIDQHAAAVPFFALDRQRHDHAVVVRDFQGVGLRRAFVGLELDVAANHQHAIGGPAEADDPLVAEIERVAAQVHHARPTSDGDRQDEFLVVLILADHHQQLLVGLAVIEVEQPVVQLAAFGHLAPFGKLLLRPGRRRPWPSRQLAAPSSATGGRRLLRPSRHDSRQHQRHETSATNR